MAGKIDFKAVAGQFDNVAVSVNPTAAKEHNPVHELSIMEDAVRMAMDQARLAGASRVHEIRLRVGALSGVVPDALQFAFEVVTDGTLAQNARLTIEQVPARFWCAPCQREFEAAGLYDECPECNTPSQELRKGRELELASLEIS